MRTLILMAALLIPNLATAGPPTITQANVGWDHVTLGPPGACAICWGTYTFTGGDSCVVKIWAKPAGSSGAYQLLKTDAYSSDAQQVILLSNIWCDVANPIAGFNPPFVLKMELIPGGNFYFVLPYRGN